MQSILAVDDSASMEVSLPLLKRCSAITGASADGRSLTSRSWKIRAGCASALPRSAVGKVLKAQARAQYQAMQGGTERIGNVA